MPGDFCLIAPCGKLIAQSKTAANANPIIFFILCTPVVFPTVIRFRSFSPLVSGLSLPAHFALTVIGYGARWEKMGGKIKKQPRQWAVVITSVLNRKNGFANGKIGAKVAVA